MFQPVYMYFKKIANISNISQYKSKGLSDEMIKSPAASNDILSPAMNDINTKLRVKFSRSCLKQEKIKFSYEKLVNIYIDYTINLCSNVLSADFELGNSFF